MIRTKQLYSALVGAATPTYVDLYTTPNDATTIVRSILAMPQTVGLHNARFSLGHNTLETVWNLNNQQQYTSSIFEHWWVLGENKTLSVIVDAISTWFIVVSEIGRAHV